MAAASQRIKLRRRRGGYCRHKCTICTQKQCTHTHTLPLTPTHTHSHSHSMYFRWQDLYLEGGEWGRSWNSVCFDVFSRPFRGIIHTLNCSKWCDCDARLYRFHVHIGQVHRALTQSTHTPIHVQRTTRGTCNKWKLRAAFWRAAARSNRPASVCITCVCVCMCEYLCVCECVHVFKPQQRTLIARIIGVP